MSVTVKALQRFLTRQAGLAFEGDQLYLAESRLLPLAERTGFSGVNALVAELQREADPELTRAALEAMTTHETFFFRDRTPFDQFRAVMLPKLLAARADSRRLRIWCTAASTGQEAYSLAMLLDEEARSLAGWNIEILATDLSHAVIDVARAGIYSQFEVQRGLPITHLLRYFRREGEGWRLNEHIRARVSFRPFNLIHDFSRLGVFDVIFCRNVLIYLEAATRLNVMKRLVPMLAADGYLALGATEAIGLAMPGIVPLPFHGSLGIKAAAMVQQRPPMRLVAAR